MDGPYSEAQQDSPEDEVFKQRRDEGGTSTVCMCVQCAAAVCVFI